MFEWKPEYSVQIATIDTQHQRLFALAAELHKAMLQGKGKEVLEPALARLVDYTKAHFANEEAFMRKHGYPGSDGHKMEHDKLTAQVLEFQKKFHNHQTLLTTELMIFLKDWLEKHIQGSDMKYSMHIRGKNAA
jgi:hemerythrin